MNSDQTSALADLGSEAEALANRAFENGPALAVLCRALASCIETNSVNMKELPSSGATFSPRHVAHVCLVRSNARADLLARWLNDAAQRLDAMPVNADDLAKIMRGEAAEYARWERFVFGEGGKR